MSNRATNIIAAFLLLLMFFIAVSSIAGDSLTMDELAHLPAGYSYLTQKDMRLNPEHPPLIKDLAAFPLLFIKGINFPSEIKSWKNDVNGQWEFGNNFLFKSGNPADKMIFLARIPMILMLMLLGFYIFKWARELWGNKVALFSLFLFSLSPTFIAHGRLVTTDVAAAFGVFFASYYFLKFLNNPKKINLVFAGIALGIAELLKFSLILLFPFFGIIIVFYSIKKSLNFKEFFKKFGKFILFFVLITVIAYLLVWLFYLYHTWNYPPEKQASDTASILTSFSNRTLADIVIWMSDKPGLKAIAQYLLGVFMILQRASGGNTGYFLGEISAAGWKIYFPFVYIVKETLTFHILSIIALLYLGWLQKDPFWRKPFSRTFAWIKSHFQEFSMILWIAIYWATSLKSDLNIGVRHLLPVFPFTILLVSYSVNAWLKPPYLGARKILILWLMLWQAWSIISVYPHFLSYFNEIAGGPKKGYLYVVDSNLDWGQDLKRLKKWQDAQGIDKIYIDYFGGADTEYYFGEKHEKWQGERNPQEFPKGNYLAVSATLLQGGKGSPTPGFNAPAGYYLWLNRYEPSARIGQSIFVYHIE